MQAILFCGPQASGKSTFYRERFFATHVRINLDMLKTRQRETALLSACLESGQRFVIDNTNPTRSGRARYISAAKARHFALVGYFFDASLPECIERNATRPGKQRIPERGIRATHKRLERLGWDEGFDAIYVVGMTGDGFTVEEIRR
jgi:predicted kinase